MIKPSCHTCVFAWWDRGQWLASLSSVFASRPVCANHPDAPGRMRPTPIGGVCRNYRARPLDPNLADGSVRRIPVTGGLYAYVDAADYEWLSKYRWCLFGGKYAARCEKGKMILMHREIMQTPPDKIVDHMDGNGMDNCRCNLRNCSRRENMRNRAKRLTTGACKIQGRLSRQETRQDLRENLPAGRAHLAGLLRRRGVGGPRLRPHGRRMVPRVRPPELPRRVAPRAPPADLRPVPAAHSPPEVQTPKGERGTMIPSP